MTKGILWIAVERTEEMELDMMWEVHPHLHVTLQFGVEEDSVKEWIGKEVVVETSYWFTNQRVQALVVDLHTGVRELCKNEVPHITMSHIKEAKPVESNALLEDWENNEARTVLWQTLKGKIEFFRFGGGK